MFLSKDRKSDGDLDVLESVGREHAGDGIEWGESTVLVLAGRELIFFTTAHTLLCFGCEAKMLITYHGQSFIFPPQTGAAKTADRTKLT